jgi:hypothetical protein
VTDIMIRILGVAQIDPSAAVAIPDPSWFEAYHSYEDHVAFLDDLQASFPDNSARITAGTSFEGREIEGIHLYGSAGPGTNPAVYFHGTVHAREWVTTMVIYPSP